MITYRSVELTAKRGSISIAKGNRTEVREYPGKDTADFFDLGKTTTKIAMTLRAETDEEKTTIEALLHLPVKGILILDNEYYKNVIPDSEYNLDTMNRFGTGYWAMPCRFIALDPVPYSVDTDEVMY